MKSGSIQITGQVETKPFGRVRWNIRSFPSVIYFLFFFVVVVDVSLFIIVAVLRLGPQDK